MHQLADFKLSMIGTSGNRDMKGVKAAESSTLLRFCVSQVGRFQDKLRGGDALLVCGKALWKYLDLTRASPWRLSASARQGICDAFVRFLTFRERAQIAWKPKTHLMIHMISDCAKFGNPYVNGTWLDEGLNIQLSRVCRSAHAQVWFVRVLVSMEHKAGPIAKAAQALKKRKQE